MLHPTMTETLGDRIGPIAPGANAMLIGLALNFDVTDGCSLLLCYSCLAVLLA
jgi:hypothetical protein